MGALHAASIAVQAGLRSRASAAAAACRPKPSAHLALTGPSFPPLPRFLHCRVQAGLLPNHIDWLREEHLKEASAAPSVQTLDRWGAAGAQHL